jgi:hypothetical protein
LVCLIAVRAHAQDEGNSGTSAEPADAKAEANADAKDDDDAPPDRPRGAPQVGIAPGTPQAGTLIGTQPEPEEPSATPTDGEWRFDFHGFLRAPMRIGFGSSEGTAPGVEKGGKVHAPPQVPDGTFTNWQYTNNVPGPWTELRFSYGNTRVTGNVLIAAYNITDGGYRNLQSQLGINQAFVTIDAADLLADGKGGLVWNVGVFQNAYGGAGRYDAGKYETYLIGRTHVAGETLTAFYNFSKSFTLTLEHGIGAKLEALPLVSGLPQPHPAYLPYGGPAQQGTQLLHHMHLMASIGEQLHIGAHYMTTWTDDARAMGELDGRITVAGIDAKLIDSRFGDAYLGYSRLSSETPIRVGEGLEVLHSIAGWNLRDNFFGQSTTGTGAIDSVLLQYVLSLARLLRYPEPFWGQGPDVVISLFGMYNHVSSEDPMFDAELAREGSHIGENRLKWGADVTYTPLGFLGIGARFDRVQPDLDDSTVAFSVVSPRLLLRSEFVTHEQILIQYSHYFYGDGVVPAWPNENRPPDEDTVMISAIMWW